MQASVLINNLTTYFSSESNGESSSENTSYSGTSSRLRFKKVKRFVRNSKYLPFVIVGIVVLLVILFALKSTSNNATSTSSQLAPSDTRADIKKPIATQTLNKEFAFPLKDQNGKEVSKLKYIVQNAELRDEIVVKGERASAVKGRLFLVLNLKIVNSFDKTVNVNARDYLRLSLNGSSEKLAPEIHNDPVEVQAISTKYTRVGFPISDTDRNLILQVGEVDGSKQQIHLDLK